MFLLIQALLQSVRSEGPHVIDNKYITSIPLQSTGHPGVKYMYFTPGCPDWPFDTALTLCPAVMDSTQKKKKTRASFYSSSSYEIDSGAAFSYSARMLSWRIRLVSALIGWAMSLYSPSEALLLGIAMNNPFSPSIIFMSCLLKQE